MTTFHIDVDGKVLVATSDPDAVIPGAVIKTDIAPASGRDTWDGEKWLPAPPLPPPPLTAVEFEDLLVDTPGSPFTRARIDAKKAAR